MLARSYPAMCLVVACDQSCPMSGSPNTTYFYSYNDNGTIHSGHFTTNENGTAEITDVSSNVDCSKITFREGSKIALEESAQE